MRLALVATLLLAGCGYYDRQLAAIDYGLPAGLPDDQADRVDGTYKGIVTLTEANADFCPPSTDGTIQIGDRTMTLTYTPSTIMIVNVQPDGTLHGQTGPVRLDGKVADGLLGFWVRSPECTSRYEFRYVV